MILCLIGGAAQPCEEEDDCGGDEHGQGRIFIFILRYDRALPSLLFNFTDIMHLINHIICGCELLLTDCHNTYFHFIKWKYICLNSDRNWGIILH